MKQYKDSLHTSTRNARKDELHLSDSGELHEVESNYSGKFSHVPSQPAVDSKSTIYAELRQTLAT